MNSNKGGIRAWLIFALLIVIIFGLLYYFRSVLIAPEEEIVEEVEKPKKEFVVIELTPKQKEEHDNAALNDAFLSGNPENCESIEYDEELKKQCLDNLNYAGILRSGDENQCEKLYDEELRKRCYDKIYFSSATSILDSALCNKITDEALRQKCNNSVQLVMGRSAKSEQDCESITDPEVKQDCLDNYYLSSSTKEIDQLSCNNIKDAELKDECIASVTQNVKVIEEGKKIAMAKVAPKSTSDVLKGCNAKSGELAQNCKDDANFNLAFQNRDLTYCNKIVDTDLKDDCIKQQTENIDAYYLRKATATGDKSLCDKIITLSVQTFCRDSIQ
jgi:hypothetical protein